MAHDTLPGELRHATGGGHPSSRAWRAGIAACLIMVQFPALSMASAATADPLASPSGGAAASSTEAQLPHVPAISNDTHAIRLQPWSAEDSSGGNPVEGRADAKAEAVSLDPVQTAKWLGISAALLLLLRHTHHRR